MMFKLFFLEILFTLFSCVVLAYISIATAIGPWIAPTLILLGHFFLWQRKKNSEGIKTVILAQTAGSLGGIISVGIGFTLPMLYFLDAKQFNAMISNPVHFAITLGLITISAGALGTWLARYFVTPLLEDENLKFPISHIIAETAQQTETGHFHKLAKGIFGSWATIFLRDGFNFGNIFSVPALIGQRQFFIGGSMLPKIFPVSISPTMWAIGWVAGIGMALPLFMGMLSKYLVLYPLNHHASWLGLSLFPTMDKIKFSSAFCSGIVLFEVLFGISRQLIKSGSWNLKTHRLSLKEQIQSFFKTLELKKDNCIETIEPWLALGLTVITLSFLSVPWYIIIFIPFACAAATHQICYFGARTGLAPFGRFITLFVMIPIALTISFAPMQMTYLCTFTAVCLAAAVNFIFQCKVGQLSSLEQKDIHLHHWIGLILTACIVGLCFWLLFSNLKLGGVELFAHRGRARALLLQSLGFNPIVLALGCGFGTLVKWLKLSPTMVFGGILMPNKLTVGLFIGALASKLVRNPTEYRPFWTGIFAGESLWISMTLLLKVLLP
ncbi:OPT/YSL family transporter [Candidatus Babeliales bacterium]|nr:OPT/YSL family transporter [Candidatus Babeliales bacterium]